MVCVQDLCVVAVVFWGCCFAGVSAQIDHPGIVSCDLSSVPVQANFDKNRFLGRWNELLWVAPFEEKDYDSTDYYWILYNQTVSHSVVHGYQKGRDVASGRCFGSNITLNETETPGVFLLTMPVNNYITRFYVVETDYDTYANTYGCYEYSSDGRQCYKGRAWLWARSARVPDSLRMKVIESWQHLCLDLQTLLKITPVTEKDCPVHRG